MLHRLISLLVVALLLTGCSRAVVIPREDVAKPEYREPGSYRIRLQGWEEYLALRFSVTDSTVVITELLPSDQRYRTGGERLPITIPLSNVASISEMKTNWPVTAAMIAVGGAILVLTVWILLDSDGGGLEGSSQ